MQPGSASIDLKSLRDAVLRGNKQGDETDRPAFDPEKHIEAYLLVHVNE